MTLLLTSCDFSSIACVLNPTMLHDSLDGHMLFHYHLREVISNYTSSLRWVSLAWQTFLLVGFHDHFRLNYIFHLYFKQSKTRDRPQLLKSLMDYILYSRPQFSLIFPPALYRNSSPLSVTISLPKS